MKRRIRLVSQREVECAEAVLVGFACRSGTAGGRACFAERLEQVLLQIGSILLCSLIAIGFIVTIVLVVGRRKDWSENGREASGDMRADSVTLVCCRSGRLASLARL